MVKSSLKPTARTPPALRVEISQLETFIAVAELGSFSLAAQRLHITQPSVTSRVQRLEAAIGTQLLVRTTRTVKPTPQGALLLDEANRTLRGMRLLVDDFRMEADALRHRVRVATTPMLASMTLPPIIRAYSEKYPDIQIQLRDLRHSDVLPALLAGEADLAVMAYVGKDKRVRFQPLRREEMVLVVPPDHPLAAARRASLNEIAAHPLMMLEQYEPMQARMAEELAQRGSQLQPAMQAGNLHTLLGMLDARMGITMLPRSMARRSEQAGHIVVEVTDFHLVRSFGVLLMRGASLSSAANSFVRHLRQMLPIPPPL